MKSLLASVAAIALLASLGSAQAQTCPGFPTNTVNVNIGTPVHFSYLASSNCAQVPGASFTKDASHCSYVQDAGGVGGWTASCTVAGTDNLTLAAPSAPAPGFATQAVQVNAVAPPPPPAPAATQVSVP